MKPALTVEEWRGAMPDLKRRGVLLCSSSGNMTDIKMFSDGHGEYSDVYVLVESRRHKIAALALDGQPFGFTREDVALLRRAEGVLDCEGFDVEAKAAIALADRIEALLPPE